LESDRVRFALWKIVGVANYSLGMPAWFHAPHYELARLLLQRGLAVVYFIAFLASLEQNRALIGERGLLPIPEYLKYVSFREAPSLFHFRYSDRALTAVSLAGMALALAAICGVEHLAVWLSMWALYLSIVNVGQTFYGFGWESLLCEAGFLAAFLGTPDSAVPMPIILLFRWLLFRLEFGAGLIKLRGDPCWRDLTCLYYHHETQPMPNPLSWYFHALPKSLHKVEVLGSHFAQLVCPVMLFLPQPFCAIGGGIMAVTQLWLVLSGNFSWLNLTTIVLCASCFGTSQSHELPASSWQDGLALAVTLLVLFLSWRPALNLLSKRQKMNASFDPLHLVNTYGAFGSVGRERDEVVVEGTSDGVTWKEYEFRAKPTDVKRMPPQFAPYHLRLDWMMWFAAISPSFAGAWFARFLRKLRENDRATLRLLRHNPFPDAPPAAIRTVLYRYRFTTWKERRETGAWWHRERLREFRNFF
jgi:hypothetical protein